MRFLLIKIKNIRRDELINCKDKDCAVKFAKIKEKIKRNCFTAIFQKLLIVCGKVPMLFPTGKNPISSHDCSFFAKWMDFESF